MTQSFLTEFFRFRPHNRPYRNAAKELRLFISSPLLRRLQLIDPTEWFGEWDAKNFLYEGGELLHNGTKKFAEYWINAGLPTELPDPTIKIDGEIEMEDEIVEHIENLDRKFGLRENN